MQRYITYPREPHLLYLYYINGSEYIIIMKSYDAHPYELQKIAVLVPY